MEALEAETEKHLRLADRSVSGLRHLLMTRLLAQLSQISHGTEKPMTMKKTSIVRAVQTDHHGNWSPEKQSNERKMTHS